MNTDSRRPPLPQLPPDPLALSRPQPAPSLYEQVYSALLEAICGGTLRPGDRINQDELAARLNVSRQPVTQALTVLRTQDFVQDTGRRGLVVTPLRKSFFKSLYELRESLDPMAARLAARNSARLSRVDAEALLAQGRLAVQDGSVAALTRADVAFHMWIYEAAGNPLLTETLRLYWHHLRRAMVAVVEPSQGRELVWDEHRCILDAILGGNELAAERLSVQHIQEAAQRVMQRLPDEALHS
jgi:DNA-binding GntR family transcriptional regulator